jgi:hypothetical protein
MGNDKDKHAYEMRVFQEAVAEAMAPDSKIKVLLITLNDSERKMSFVHGRMDFDEACEVMAFVLDSLDALDVDEMDREHMQ